MAHRLHAAPHPRFAVLRVLLRPRAPRHPPNTRQSLATSSRAKPSRGTRCVLARALMRCSRYLTQLASAKLKQIATMITMPTLRIASHVGTPSRLFLSSTSICGCSCASCCHSDTVRRRHAPRVASSQRPYRHRMKLLSRGAQIYYYTAPDMSSPELHEFE